MWRGIPATFAILMTIRQASRRDDWITRDRSKKKSPAAALAAAGFQDAEDGHSDRHGRGLDALSTYDRQMGDVPHPSRRAAWDRARLLALASAGRS